MDITQFQKDLAKLFKFIIPLQLKLNFILIREMAERRDTGRARISVQFDAELI